MSILVACLTVTNRPAWMPFCRYQVQKQVGFGDAVHMVMENPRTIAEGRSELVRRARLAGARYLAWFDDDDWSRADRLLMGVSALEDNPALSSYGNVRSWFISTETRKGLLYQAPEGIIFNGAVFRSDRVPEKFAAGLPTGEDTDWLRRYLDTRPSYVITGHYMHAWLCHRENITNKSSAHAFDQSTPPLLTPEEWRLVPA